MQTVKIANLEPLPGYRLLTPLGKGGFGEVWKCEAPGGLFKAIKFVRAVQTLVGGSGPDVEQEMRALHHIKAIRHPFLLSLERVEIVEKDLVIVMELADRSLHDLLQQYQRAGCSGIPRDELLAYLGEAAEVLDLMNLQHGLQHLDIKPRNLFLVSGHVKVADFGLVNSLTDPDGQERLRPCEAITPLYAAPEVFLGRLNPFCDQYSLAITFQELMTGTLPFPGESLRQLAMQHMYDEPALQALPADDRPIVARALAKEPSQRFACCSDLIEALLEVSPPCPSSRVRRPSGLVPRIDLSASGSRSLTGKVSGLMRPVEPSTIAGRSSYTLAVAEPKAPPVPSTPPAPLPGYELVERLRFPDIAEVWKGRNSEGRLCLIRLLIRMGPEQLQADKGPLARLRALRHPCLMPVQVLVQEPRQVALICDWPEQTLADLLRVARQGGAIGVPRRQLLDHLGRVAETLDELYEKEGLQHLGLTPRQIALHGEQVLLQDFGLAELLWMPAGQGPAELNPRYAAPELFSHKRSQHSDQYSLAAIYYELATGMPLFRNLSQRHLAAQKTQGPPDVSMLPSAERAVVLGALQVQPQKRYPSCRDFIQALQRVTVDGKRSSARNPRVQTPVAASARRSKGSGVQGTVAPGTGEDTQVEPGQPLPPLLAAEQMHEAIAQYLAAAAGPWKIGQAGSLHYRFSVIETPQLGSPGKTPRTSVVLEHNAFGCLMPATVSLKIKTFQDDWRLRLIEARGPWSGREDPLEDRGSTHFQYSLSLPASFWQRWRGRKPELRVAVTFTPIRRAEAGLTHVQIHIQSRDCDAATGKQLLESFGPAMLRALHTSLQLSPERRGTERLPLAQSVRVFPLLSPHEVGDAINAEARDVSSSGMGLSLPFHPRSDMLIIELTVAGSDKLYVPGRVRRVERAGGDRFDVGVQLLFDLPEAAPGC